LGTMAVLWRLISYFPYLMIGSIILPRWLAKQGKQKD
jgi:glycosyltransferase 2 family protein